MNLGMAGGTPIIPPPIPPINPGGTFVGGGTVSNRRLSLYEEHKILDDERKHRLKIEDDLIFNFIKIWMNVN